MNGQAKVVIRPPQTQTEFEDYYGLRYRVLRMPFGYEPDSAKDEYDSSSCCWHLSALLDGVIIGSARLHRDDDGKFIIRWVAVDPNQRHRGVGRLLILALEDTARRQGVKQVELISRNTALGFYAKLGYNELEVAKPVIDVAGKPVIEQTKMSKSL